MKLLLLTKGISLFWESSNIVTLDSIGNITGINDGINVHENVEEGENVDGVRAQNGKNLNEVMTWRGTGDLNNVISQEKTADIYGSWGRIQYQENQKIKSKKKLGNNLATHGIIHAKEKGGGISTSRVEGLLSKFNIGDSHLVTAYETFNLVRKDIKERTENTRSIERSDDGIGGMGISDVADAKDDIDLDEPPDMEHIIIKNHHFVYGGHGANMETQMEKNVKDNGDYLDGAEEDEVVCETL